MCFLFLATLTIPEELPQYKKNAYTIFHELLTRIDELTIELNIRQMQMASLFTSMQQVEIRRRKEGETIEEYNRHKSLANLTKARFMKQMEKITKELKKDTLLTHNYPIPMPTNQTVLTNTLSQKTPDNIVLPDIETNVQEQLNRLGISNLLLTTTKKPKEESSQTTSLSTRTTPPHENSATTPQSTGKLNKLLREKLRQESKEDHIQVSPPQDKNVGYLPITMEHSRNQEQDKQPSPTNHIYAEIPQKKTEKLKSNEEEEEDSKYDDFETTDDEEPETSNTKCKRQKPTKPVRLNRQQHRTAYPWAHNASDNATMKTNLADEIEYINHPKVHHVLTDKMKKMLIQRIQLPRDIRKEIDQQIQETKNKFICKICSNSFDKKYHAQHHTKIEMGYYDYRCSFCNYLSNTTVCIYQHYASRHGIPKDWVTSQNLTHFITRVSDADTYN